MPDSNVTITYANIAASEDSRSLSLSLDEDKNRETYGQSKSSFAPGEAAYLKLLPTMKNYDLYSSTGTIKTSAKRIAYEISEDISFTMSKSAALQYFPSGSVSWEWIGNAPESPLFTGKTVTIGSPAVAILRCTYNVLGDRLKLTVNQAEMGDYDEIDVTVVAVSGESQASATVSYGGEAGVPHPVDLEVSSFCREEEVVEGVEVFIDGESKGTTNSNGLIYIGDLVPGSVHQLKMINKDGFKDSDRDPLYNDEFTVPMAKT